MNRNSVNDSVEDSNQNSFPSKAEPEDDEESLDGTDFTPKSVKPRSSSNTGRRNSERQSSMRSGRDRSIVSATPLNDSDDDEYNSSGGGGDGPRLLMDKEKELAEKEAFLFNMNGSRFSGMDFFDMDDITVDGDNENNDEVGVKLIDGSAGSRIRVILGSTGQSFLLLIDEDDGEKQWQSKSWVGIPDGLAQKLKDVEYVHQCSFSNNGTDWFLKARSAKTGTTRSWWNVESQSFDSAIETAIDGGLEVRVVFGSTKNQFIVLLGPNGYTLGSDLPEGLLTAMDEIYDAETTIARIRGLNTDGRFLVEELIDDGNDDSEVDSKCSGSMVGVIRSVYHAKGLSPHLQNALELFVENQETIFEIGLGIDDSSWLIIREDAWDGSVGIHDELAQLLDNFYDRHARRQAQQADLLSVLNQKKRLQEQKRLLAVAEGRRNPTPTPKVQQIERKKQVRTMSTEEKHRKAKEAAQRAAQRKAHRREKALEACKVAGKRRDKEDRLSELMWKDIGIDDAVTVLGVSAKAGDVTVVGIDKKTGIVQIRLPAGLVKRKARRDNDNDSVNSTYTSEVQVIPIHDTRRLTKFTGGDAFGNLTELSSLVDASDKYEAAIMLCHSHSENGACVCKQELHGFSQRDVQQTQMSIGDRVHVIGYADATIIRSSERYAYKNLIHVEYDDRSTYHVNASQLQPIGKYAEVGKCCFLQPTSQHEDSALRIRPFYEELTPKNHGEIYRFDEYCCVEKVDIRRLQRLVDDLRSDCATRQKTLEDFQKLVEDNTESTKFEICLETLQNCLDLEETVYSLFDILKGFPRNQDGFFQHSVHYRHVDIGQRGRLFATGRSVRRLNHSFPRSLTLQGIQTELLAPLTGAFCRYVDCENSDIRLLCSLGKQIGVESMIPTITDYRNFRAKWLEAIQREHPDTTETEVKRLANIILFGGSYEDWLQQVDEDPVNKVKRFAFRLHAETRAIRDQLLNHPRFQWIYLERKELEQEDLQEESIKMVLFQRILHSCENVVLGIVHRAFHNCGWRVRAKIFDSLLVESSQMVDSSSLDLDKMMEIAQRSCLSMGWDIVLKEKPLYGLQDSALATIEDARTIVNAIEQVSTGGPADIQSEDFWN